MTASKAKKVKKVRAIVEIDQDILSEIDKIRGETELPHMLGIITRLGFNTMKDYAKQISTIRASTFDTESQEDDMN